MKLDVIRACTFRPYRRGHGPSFHLTMWAADATDERGQTTIAYRLTMVEKGMITQTLFEGADFHGSPLHADDSDATVAGLMEFLTLRPGDTDADYFANYTPVQMTFVGAHAEALYGEVSSLVCQDD